jgi:hypothetical protein
MMDCDKRRWKTYLAVSKLIQNPKNAENHSVPIKRMNPPHRQYTRSEKQNFEGGLPGSVAAAQKRQIKSGLIRDDLGSANAENLIGIEQLRRFVPLGCFFTCEYRVVLA